MSCAPSSDDWDPFVDVDVQLGELIVQSVSANACCTAEEYVNGENDMPTCPDFDNETWDRDFMESIEVASNSENEGHSDDNDDEEEAEALPSPKMKNMREVISSLEDVKCFMQAHGLSRESAQVHSLIDNLVLAVIPRKQSDIREYLMSS